MRMETLEFSSWALGTGSHLTFLAEMIIRALSSPLERELGEAAKRRERPLDEKVFRIPISAPG